MEEIISVQGLTYSYRGAQEFALANINFKVNEGEFIGIVGPTGAGKTTLCLCLSGIIPQVTPGGRIKGKVTIRGRDTRTHSVSKLAELIGLVMEDPETQFLMPDVEREVAFGPENLCIPRDEIRRRLDNAVRVVRMSEYLHRHPFELSGGQKQRVAIASELAMQPDILVLDEPTSELDPIGTEEVFAAVRSLKEQGKTIVMVEHKMEELAEDADRVYVLDHGEIVEEGPTKETFSKVDFLERIGLSPPDVTCAASLLRKKGFQIDSLPTHEDEAVEIFRKILGAPRK